MTDLDKLVLTLAEKTPTRGRSEVALRIGLGLVAGGAGALLLLFAMGRFDGSGTDIAPIAARIAKIAYSSALAIGAAILVFQFAAPETKAARRQLFALSPVAIMAMIAMTELALTPPEEWMRLMAGYGVSHCLTTILAAAPPIYVGLMWSFRKLAPTATEHAGAWAGALSGAGAALLYAVVSGDASVCFVFIWFTISILISAISGALLGRYFLRW